MALGLVPARDSRSRSWRSAAFFMKEPPRGQFEKDHVLHEVIEEKRPAPISMEAAFTRLKRIATIRTVLVAFCALGLRPVQPGDAVVALPEQRTCTSPNVLHRGIILSLSGSALCRCCPLSGSTSTGSTARIRPRRWRSSGC